MSAHNEIWNQRSLPYPADNAAIALETLENGTVLRAYGLVVPSDATAGYAIGCLFQHLDGGDGTSLYVNEGTAASCDFNAVTVA